MEGFDFDDVNTTTEKRSSFPAIIGSVGEIKKLFRIAEILLLLLMLTWTSTRLPFAVRISGEYLRCLLSVVVSHLFIFLLSNAIVLVLFFKSRSLFLHHAAFQDHREINVEDFISSSSGGGAYFAGESLRSEEVVYQDKRTILEVTKVRAHVKRSQSENFWRSDDCGGCKKELRRSETEIQRRVVEEKAEAEVVDELSNEEFQRAIDAFIAKQIKFHQQEKLAIVLHECN